MQMKCLHVSHILFPGQKVPSPALYLCIFLTLPPHQTQPSLLFFLSDCQLVKPFFIQSAKKVEQKQINAGLGSETLLGLAGHQLSSVFYNHSLSVEPSLGFFNCPSAGKRV